MRNIALIPARGGSERITKKNLVDISGHPLISYTINSALNCREIHEVYVSTDDQEIAETAIRYGAKVPSLRPKRYADSLSPDILWIKHSIISWLDSNINDNLLILRPTNPLRRSETISKALETTEKTIDWHSLRAVRKVKEHPRKMWQSDGELIEPFLPQINPSTGTESHSSPMQALEALFIQDASLEITKVNTILNLNSLSGNLVIPFHMPNYEGFDINYPEDIEYLKYLIEASKVELESPKIRV
jgi:CMP-N,N'-diacetyllegionaminic acid synthase